MTFKRLMDYAEQGIDHRAIPGIDATCPVASSKAQAGTGGKRRFAPALGAYARMLSSEVTRSSAISAPGWKGAGRRRFPPPPCPAASPVWRIRR